MNLRTGRQGIFPAAHVTDVDYSDFDPTVPKVKKERYLLNYLGSIETLCHKGNQVIDISLNYLKLVINTFASQRLVFEEKK